MCEFFFPFFEYISSACPPIVDMYFFVNLSFSMGYPVSILNLSSPFFNFQELTVPSFPKEIIAFSWKIQIPVTAAVWPCNTLIACIFLLSQIRTDLSEDAEITEFPVTFNAVIPSVCPSIVATHFPLIPSHAFTVLSMEPDQTEGVLLCLSVAMSVTSSAWPSKSGPLSNV